mmetsp:Transcript_34848/g.74282  ORF Transcript_34848/g.74282 Transcript_34848/m.74282 type:complete len:489 (+) Transcript_34848:126-1592(+)
MMATMQRFATKIRRRRAPQPPFARPLLALLPFLLLAPASSVPVVKNYVPVSYPIPFGTEECLYERIARPGEHLTASVFLLSGEELASAIVFEGPVAPPMDLDAQKSAGRDLKRYLDRYEKEGTKMFVNGKYGDEMVNVKPVRVAEMVNFEEEEEDFYDDFTMGEREREEFNAHHDLEHQHPQHAEQRHHDDRPLPPDDDRMRRGERPPPPGRRRMPEGEGNEYGERKRQVDDDYFLVRDQRLREQLEREAEMDDDFVKLQTEKGVDEPQRKKTEPEAKGVTPQRRKIVGNIEEHPHGRRLMERNEEHETEDEPPHGRRLREELRLVAGEPYQNTVLAESPGWYRLCVHGKSTAVIVEMELRKSSIFGKVDSRTGHVPYMTEVETHSDIRTLFTKEDDEEILAEEGVLTPEDLRISKEQLRLLERVYSEIMNKQIEERRVWNWRTVKNQHLYSHLVLGNLVETIVYMGITGWQVYTIRKWFGGGPALGR